MVKPSRRREMAHKVVSEQGVCIRVACVAFRISESCYRYERKLDAENDEVANWLIKLTDNHRSGALASAICICATSRALNGASQNLRANVDCLGNLDTEIVFWISIFIFSIVLKILFNCFMHGGLSASQL